MTKRAPRRGQGVRSTGAGRRYRALVGLAYPTSAEAIARIEAGEEVPWAERRVREVAAGEVVSDIPESSLPWLLEQGLVEEVGRG